MKFDTIGIIKGWRELYDFSLMEDSALRRAMALYSFPRARKVREGSRLHHCWCKNEVLEWLTENGTNPKGWSKWT